MILATQTTSNGRESFKRRRDKKLSVFARVVADDAHAHDIVVAELR